MSIDPWFRPRGKGNGTLMLADADGPGMWIVNRTPEVQLNILKNRTLGVDDEALLQEHGIYYAKRK